MCAGANCSVGFYLQGREMEEVMKINEQENKWVDRLMGKYILIRSNMSGVWVGRLVGTGAQGNVLALEDARRIRYWEGAIDCSDLAVNGMKKPDESRVMVTEVFKVLNGWEELAQLTPEAKDIIFGCKEHQYE